MQTPPGYRLRQELMDADRLRRTLARIAHEIVERHPDPSDVILVGIRSRGVPLARRLAGLIRETAGLEPPVGALDITLYRDDLETVGPKPLVGETHLPVDLDGRHVWIVDDVLFTGRTVRAALQELTDFGRPSRIGLAVLVDRGGRELPIQADVAGTTVATRPGDRVEVFVTELDGRDAVEVARGGGRP